MSDDRRGDWTWPNVVAMYRCSVCGAIRHEGMCACSPDEPPLVARDYAPVEVMPVSQGVPLALLRAWIADSKTPHAHRNDYERGEDDMLQELADLLDEFERTTNHNDPKDEPDLMSTWEHEETP